jgi:uncharacterized protein YigA (DUF484 family)
MLKKSILDEDIKTSVSLNTRDLEYLSERIGRLESVIDSLTNVVMDLKEAQTDLKHNLSAKSALYGVLAASPSTLAVVIVLLFNLFKGH